jgi:hypothetical protein
LVPFPHIILCVYLHNINRKFLKNIKSLFQYGTNGLWHIRYSFGTGTKYTLLYVAGLIGGEEELTIEIRRKID